MDSDRWGSARVVILEPRRPRTRPHPLHAPNNFTSYLLLCTCACACIFFFFLSPRALRARKFSRRPPSESSSVGFNAVEATHADPLTRQLMLMLLAVETKAKVSTPEEGGGGAVNREWIK